MAQVIDPHSWGVVEPLIPVGGRYLELGAGTGSIAKRAADKVGAAGLAVATDINTKHIQPHEFLNVVTHDLQTDPISDLDPELWNAIRARCLFAHLGKRDTLVAPLADALKPGGHLVIEDWGATGGGFVLRSPYKRTEVLFQQYQAALMAYLRSAGNDGTWIQRAHKLMVEAGLEVTTFTSAKSWNGRSPGCKLPISMSIQIEEHLVEHGMGRDDIYELRDHLNDPDVVLMGNLTWSFVGRKPVEG
ncbi:methyltransferase domain-containing protein [Virgisporangium aurantiacum]|uniref:methyltransferase domain-containing protein n=1 Tax=Virgisporangium aurantiacum TaxID=175570 RepID=UPI00194E2E71|nr:methyltransferase domain-containing protein [Virgisporangium aurantiacum]